MKKVILIPTRINSKRLPASSNEYQNINDYTYLQSRLSKMKMKFLCVHLIG